MTCFKKPYATQRKKHIISIIKSQNRRQHQISGEKKNHYEIIIKCLPRGCFVTDFLIEIPGK